MRLLAIGSARTVFSTAGLEACSASLIDGLTWSRVFGSGNVASYGSAAVTFSSSQCIHGAGCTCQRSTAVQPVAASARHSTPELPSQANAHDVTDFSSHASRSGAASFCHASTCRCTVCRAKHGNASATLGFQKSSVTSTMQHISPWVASQDQPAGVRSMACSANLHRAPPKKIIIEYDPEDVDLYIEVADAIEAAFPSMVVEGNEGSTSGREGAFEVTTPEGVVIFSRLAERRMLAADALVERLVNRPGAAQEEDDNAPRIVCQ